MNYLQEDFAAISVCGNFGQCTQNVFRSLQKGTSTYTPAVIDNLKSAITFVAASGNLNQNYESRPRRYFDNNRQRGFGLNTYNNRFNRGRGQLKR